MATTNIDCALGSSQTGEPLSTSALVAIKNAMQGGDPTATFFHNQFEAFNFTNWLNTEGDAAWNITEDKDGQPIIWAAQLGSAAGNRAGQRAQSLEESNAMSIVLRTVPDNDVLQEKKTPGQFIWNGKTYNIVGTLTMTLAYDQDPTWQVTIPLGVINVIPVSFLLKIAWPNFVKPLLLGFWNGVKYCFNAARALATGGDVAEATALAGDEAAVDGAEVAAGTTVSLIGGLAFAGAIVLSAIPFIIEIFAHPSYHSVKLYNLTPYDITWGMPYLDEGAMNMAPSTGTQGSFEYKIPAQSMYSPSPDIPPVLVSHEADFSFASTSQYKGLGYAMPLTITNPKNHDAQVASAAILFEIPWDGNNSLAAASPQPGSLETFFDDNEGQHKDTKMDISLDGDLHLTLTYDYLDGQHPSPSGQNMYTYSSLAVLYTNASL